MNDAQPLLIVISGPSGVGKGELLTRLRKTPGNRHFAVTATTRPPRPGEKHGQDYFFVSSIEFQRMQDADEFMESATVHGHKYGTPRQQVYAPMATGQDVILETDVQGAAKIRAIIPATLLIFIMPEDENALRRRLQQRGTNSKNDMEHRLSTANTEMAQAGDFDHIVTNRNNQAERAIQEIELIIAAAKMPTNARRPSGT